MQNGHTLLELCVVLLLAALAASVALPAGRHLHDAFAVVSGRDALAGLIAEARAMAPGNGGASVHLRDRPWRAWAQAGGTWLRSVELADDLGVTVVLPRGRRALDLRFDVLGLGQVASETIVLQRGDSRRTLIISSYGRVRRP